MQMAESNISVSQDQFSCLICLETLKDPVTTSCGHSFCLVCINNCWDQEDDKESYSCPQCRKTFTPRPAVSKNTILAGVVENLKEKESQVLLPTEPEDVECDSCTGRKYKAVKSCLVCLASYCESHIQPHYESPAFKKHKLVKASRRLQEQICSQHDPPLEPQTREDFLQYFCGFTLDPNTVNKHLSLFEENKVVTWNGPEHSYPDHPDRFDYYPQVLCRESVSGRCYWEVEWSGNNGVCIAVAYKSISRKAPNSECVFGNNNPSWTLFCSPSRFLFWHNNEITKIPIMSSSSRIGVYVDYRAGTLSFYSVSDTMKLLHRVQTTFTQLLYPGFWIGLGTKVKLSDSTN